MKADHSQVEFKILFLGVTAILSYPPSFPNYQLPIVAISKNPRSTHSALPVVNLVKALGRYYRKYGAYLILGGYDFSNIEEKGRSILDNCFHNDAAIFCLRIIKCRKISA
jgi:hypothetical protein